MWSRKDFLAVATSGAALEIYPYFREDTRFSGYARETLAYAYYRIFGR
jgi:hypothetical protein